ncbi:unnamed protein product [Bemisia tabaci]|uniref:DNA-directed RNA polymerase II subunit GRINL1A n=1 Tax=Bemisia tabaci TaxID=7038 RepID=A0A9P0AD25_BEMTA|nr:unnamed protein product [Bemisia tabaci]
MLESKIKRVPGRLPPISSQDKESQVEDISKLPKSKLLELIDRQKKIVNNRAFLSRLPDKGAKITSKYENLLAELKKREDTETNLCSLMSTLAVGKQEVADIEWTGNCNPGISRTKAADEGAEDSDSEDVDPLKIIATHSGAGFAKKELRIEKPQESLIKESDLKDDDAPNRLGTTNEQEEEVASALRNIEEYAVHLCEKFDVTSPKKDEKFYPHKTVKEKHVNKSKESLSQKDKPWWEVTAATPPLPVHETVKVVSLKESLVIQQKQAEQLKEVQAKHAAERLIRMRGIFPDSTSVPSNFGDYREHKEVDSDGTSDDEEKECLDEEVERERDVAVFYNVVD